MVRSRGKSDLSNLDDDPLTRAMAPPPNETAEERAVRLAGEKEAQLRSAAIDEEINRERLANKKNKCVRILLLGQSESGKSTTLKNFQLFHSDKAFKAERASWRAVVQLNVVKSIRTILDTMADAIATPPPDRASLPELNSEHRALRMRLSPLQQVEEALLRRLSPAGSLEWEATHLAPVTNLPDNSFRSGNGANGNEGRSRTEIAVNSTTQWKNAFTRLLSANRDSMDSQNIDFGDPQDPGHILNACADDMISLWNDPTIRRLLQVKKIRLQEKSGFFLDELARVTSLKYVPTDDDILKARLKTLGVSEHRFTLKGAGNMVSHDWRVFDVGGARSNRAAWVPFFDNMDAIIFLAPISGFDETLAEDPNVNRLEDSILLWQAIIKNPLLKDTEVVLFLNKIDLFKEKLTSGVSFGHYVVSYGNRPNDFDSTSKYLIRKFSNIHKQFSPRQRTFYCHLTTVTDSKSTQHILGNVKDMVLRQNLMEGSLM